MKIVREKNKLGFKENNLFKKKSQIFFKSGLRKVMAEPLKGLSHFNKIKSCVKRITNLLEKCLTIKRNMNIMNNGTYL